MLRLRYCRGMERDRVDTIQRKYRNFAEHYARNINDEECILNYLLKSGNGDKRERDKNRGDFRDNDHVILNSLNSQNQHGNHNPFVKEIKKRSIAYRHGKKSRTDKVKQCYEEAAATITKIAATRLEVFECLSLQQRGVCGAKINYTLDKNIVNTVIATQLAHQSKSDTIPINRHCIAIQKLIK